MSNWIDDLTKDRRANKYVAHAGEVEFLKASEDDHTGRTVKFRVVCAPEDAGKANPFSKFTRRRRNKGGARFEASFVEIDGPRELMLEAVLINWASSPQGDTVVFLVDFSSDQHPFMGCTRPSKEARGTRFMLVAVEKDDDEQLVEQEKQERLEQAKRTGKRQTLSNVARLMTKNPRFWEWLDEIDGSAPKWDTNLADSWLKAALSIESKAELDAEGPESVSLKAAFHKIRAMFVEWQEANGYETEE